MFGVDDFDIIFIMLGLGLIIGAVVVAMFFSNHCKDKEPPEQVCKDGSDFQNRWYEKRWFWGFIVPGVFFLIMGIIASVQGWGGGTRKVYDEGIESGLRKIESSDFAPTSLKEVAVNKRADIATKASVAGKRRYKGKK